MVTDSQKKDKMKASELKFISPTLTHGEPKKHNQMSDFDTDDSDIEALPDQYRKSSFVRAKSQKYKQYDNDKLPNRPQSNYIPRNNHRNTFTDSDNDEKVPVSLKRMSHHNYLSNDTSSASVSSRNINLPPKNFCEGEPVRNVDFTLDQEYEDLHIFHPTQSKKLYQFDNLTSVNLNDELRDKERKILALEKSLRQAQGLITELSNQPIQTAVSPTQQFDKIRKREPSYHTSSRPNSQTNSTRTDSGFSNDNNNPASYTNVNPIEELPFDFDNEVQNSKLLSSSPQILNELKNEKREWENYACRLTRVMVEKERFFLTHESQGCSPQCKFETENERRWAVFSMEVLRRLLKHSPREVDNLIKTGYSDFFDVMKFDTSLDSPRPLERKL